MAILYAQGAHATVTGPETWQPGWVAARLPGVLLPVAVGTAEDLVVAAQEAYWYSPLTDRFVPGADAGPGAALIASVASADPILPFLNYDVAAHWPPWGPDTPFGRWAARTGIPAYLAARSYARRPHPGRLAMERLLAAAGDAFMVDVRTAVTGLLET